MLGRYSLTNDKGALEAIEWIDRCRVDHRPRYNIAPGQTAPVVCLTRHGVKVVRSFRWGLVPSWAEDANVGYKLLTAPGEGLDRQSAFQHAFRYHRCLVLADGFYRLDPGEDGEKRIYWIHRGDGAVFPMLGLWEEWVAPTGERSVLHTFSIVTAPDAVNPGLPGVEPMPAVPAEELREAWLDPESRTPWLEEALFESVTADFEARRVSSYVIEREHEDPRCVEPYS